MSFFTKLKNLWAPPPADYTFHPDTKEAAVERKMNLDRQELELMGAVLQNDPEETERLLMAGADPHIKVHVPNIGVCNYFELARHRKAYEALEVLEKIGNE